MAAAISVEHKYFKIHELSKIAVRDLQVGQKFYKMRIDDTFGSGEQMYIGFDGHTVSQIKFGRKDEKDSNYDSMTIITGANISVALYAGDSVYFPLSKDAVEEYEEYDRWGYKKVSL